MKKSNLLPSSSLPLLAILAFMPPSVWSQTPPSPENSEACREARYSFHGHLVQRADQALMIAHREIFAQNHRRVQTALASATDNSRFRPELRPLATTVASALQRYPSAPATELQNLESTLSAMPQILRELGNQDVSTITGVGFVANAQLPSTVRTYSDYTVRANFPPGMISRSAFTTIGEDTGHSTMQEMINPRFAIRYCQHVSDAAFAIEMPELHRQGRISTPALDLICSTLDLRTGIWTDQHMNYIMGANLSIMDEDRHYPISLARFARNAALPECVRPSIPVTTQNVTANSSLSDAGIRGNYDTGVVQGSVAQ